MEDKYYTVSELANILRVNRLTITSLIKRGKILAVNVGTDKRAHWRIYEGQYLKFLADSYEKEE